MNLHRTGYRIIKKLYSQAKAIMAEHHPDPDALKKALAVGHSIDIDQVPGGDPMLYIVDSQIAREKMREYKIEQPTLLQIIGCSTIIALSEQDAIDEYASNYEKRKAVSRIDLWRWVKAHIAAKLSVPEKEVTDKDLAYFVRRMGVTYLIRQTYGMTTVTAELA